MRNFFGLFSILFAALLPFQAMAAGPTIQPQEPSVTASPIQVHFLSEDDPVSSYSICGNGRTDAGYEVCDGSDPHNSHLGVCAEDCQSSCGDAAKQGEEECDLGINNGGVNASCSADCQKKAQIIPQQVLPDSTPDSPTDPSSPQEETPSAPEDSPSAEILSDQPTVIAQKETDGRVLLSPTSTENSAAASPASGGCSMSQASTGGSISPFMAALCGFFLLMRRALKKKKT